MTFLQYMRLIKTTMLSTFMGMFITIKIFSKAITRGTVTIQYPEMRDNIPPDSRGLLFNDVEDCISCRACANICPVDCIHIEADKKVATATPEFTKGGVKKTLDLKRFDIDVSLCCYCGLCSSVCPTDCLYHTKDYEYSTYDRDHHNVDYLNYTR
ncbi:MAG: 4Fe-4S binding protein [Deltaproteobacteria bacterium]|nr:4Fe-4S binding protein [Deltaproteobacteria bacterium]